MNKTRESVPEVIDKLIGDVANRGKEMFGEALGDAEDLVNEKFSTLKRKASEWGLDEVAGEVKSYVKKNPWKSLGIAVGVGFVLSSLFKSSRGDN